MDFNLQVKILIANDHGGLELKWKLIDYLSLNGHDTINLGVNTKKRVDYPDIAEIAGKEFFNKKKRQKESYDFGILVCGTGIGMSMAANKIPGVRCALIHDLYTARMAKSHNDANMIAIGGRVDYSCSPLDMIQAFIDEKVQTGRHEKRRMKLR